MAAVAAGTLSAAARTIDAVFADANVPVLLPLTRVNRLDMIDYYRYGSATPVEDKLRTPWHITEITDNTMTLATADSSTVQLAIVPAGRDTLMAVVVTTSLPARNSAVTFYRPDGSVVTTPRPRYTDWLQPGALESDPDFETTLPFVTATAEFDSTATVLTYRNTASQYLTADDYRRLEPMIVPEIVYNVSGAKLTPR